MNSKFNVVILAAGKGSRMNSSIAKVCHKLAGKPLIQHVLDTALSMQPVSISVVVGYQHQQVMELCKDVNIVMQDHQLGTAHAAMLAADSISNSYPILILYGDVPLIEVQDIQKLMDNYQSTSVSLLTTTADNPFGYGRVIRDKLGNIIDIIEECDADLSQKKITEIFTGVLAVESKYLLQCRDVLTSQNQQQEYYLPDIVKIAKEDGHSILSHHADDYYSVQGVNNRIDLERLSAYYQDKVAHRLMLQGITITNRKTVNFSGEIKIGIDSIIDTNVSLDNVKIGTGVHIGANSIIKNTSIGDNVIIKPNSIIEGSTIASNSSIGPFARIRPNTVIEENVSIGNFVEIKYSYIQNGSKVNHLSYIGNSNLMSNVNIGAGTITCNYDGVKKHETVIGSNAFIGSGTQLIAPITIGKRATIGAGSTISRDVADDTLALTRSTEKHIANWFRKKKEK